VIMGVDDGVLEYFNRQSVKTIMHVIGMTVTAANKEAEIIPAEPVKDLSFLKSNFVQRNGYVAAPLPIGVIHRELQWGKKINDGDKTIMEQKIDMAMQMMAHHGREAADLLKRQLESQKIKVVFDFNLWERTIRDKQEKIVVEGLVVENTDVEEYMLTDFVDQFDDFNYEDDWGIMVEQGPVEYVVVRDWMWDSRQNCSDLIFDPVMQERVRIKRKRAARSRRDRRLRLKYDPNHCLEDTFVGGKLAGVYPASQEYLREFYVHVDVLLEQVQFPEGPWNSIEVWDRIHLAEGHLHMFHMRGPELELVNEARWMHQNFADTVVFRALGAYAPFDKNVVWHNGVTERIALWDP